MSPSESAIYQVKGSQPRPIPDGGAGRLSWRAPFLVVAAMFGWMLFVFILAVAAAPNDPNVEVPIEVGGGVVVTPADGWYSAVDVWDPGPGSISLQKAGVYVAFWVESDYRGTNDDLLNQWLDGLKPDFESLRVLPATETSVAGDLPGLTALFSGVSETWGAENELVVATNGDLGVVMLATAATGQLARVQGDLKTMLDTMVVPR